MGQYYSVLYFKVRFLPHRERNRFIYVYEDRFVDAVLCIIRITGHNTLHVNMQ
jgi:hypothetical protein